MSINDLTDPDAITRALNEYDALGGAGFLKQHDFGQSERYFISHRGRLYDAKAVAGVAYGFQHPSRPELGSGDFTGGVTGANVPLEKAGFTVVDRRPVTPAAERTWRELVYAHLKAVANPAGLNTAGELRFLGAFGNMRGIWVDKKRTKEIDPVGVTVALKHTGRHYDDAVTDQGMAYYYPNTEVKPQDQAEVEATKRTAALGVPVFAVLEEGTLREVRLAWIEGWDDTSEQFYVSFEAQPPQKILDHDRSEEEPFELNGNRSYRKQAMVRTRPDQTKFKFQAVQRYGKRCPFTGLEVLEMLEAAHLKPDAAGGTSDPRNGLVMSAALHRAFDANLFAINPETFEVETRPNGPSIKDLHIKHNRLDLDTYPHPAALEWRYETWKKSWQS